MGEEVFSDDLRNRITLMRDRYPMARSAVIPALWAVQEEHGFLSDSALEAVAKLLGLVPSDVQASASFYSMYFRTAPGRHDLVVCTNVSCALRGANEVVACVERALDCPSGGTAADGTVTWVASPECLGACDAAPALQLDHETYGPMTVAETEALIRRVASEAVPSKAAHHPVVSPAVTAQETGPGAGSSRAGSDSEHGMTREERPATGKKTRRARVAKSDL